jgi:hypothetical protein
MSAKKKLKQSQILIFPVNFKFRCLVSACGDTSDTSPFLPPWLSDAIPLKPDGSPLSCEIYRNLNSSANTCSFDQAITERCHEWVYDGPERTIHTEVI